MKNLQGERREKGSNSRGLNRMGEARASSAFEKVYEVLPNAAGLWTVNVSAKERTRKAAEMLTHCLSLVLRGSLADGAMHLDDRLDGNRLKRVKNF